MVPWAIISAMSGNLSLAIALIILYLIVMLQRQFLEPKIVGSQIGVHPIFTLIAMFTGFRLLGVMGMYLGPIILIVIKCIFSETIEGGIIKSILSSK